MLLLCTNTAKSLITDQSCDADWGTVKGIGNLNSRPGRACMHYLSVADVHCHMVDTAAVSVEEQVSRFRFIGVDCLFCVTL